MMDYNDKKSLLRLHSKVPQIGHKLFDHLPNWKKKTFGIFWKKLLSRLPTSCTISLEVTYSLYCLTFQGWSHFNFWHIIVRSNADLKSKSLPKKRLIFKNAHIMNKIYLLTIPINHISKITKIYLPNSHFLVQRIGPTGA